MIELQYCLLDFVWISSTLSEILLSPEPKQPTHCNVWKELFYEGLDQVHHPDRPRVLIIRDWRSVGRNMQIRWTPWFWWVESQYPVCKRNVGTGYRVAGTAMRLAHLCRGVSAIVRTYRLSLVSLHVGTDRPTYSGAARLPYSNYCTRLSHAPLLFCTHGTSWGWSNFCLPSQSWKLCFVNELYMQFSFVLMFWYP